MNKLLFILIIFLSTTSIAQLGGVRLGDPFPPETGDRYYLQEGNSVLALKAGKKTVAVQKFDLKTHHEASVFRYKDLLPGFCVEALEKVGDKYFLFYSVKDKASGTVGLLSRELNFETGQLADETKDVVAVENASNWMLTEKGYNEAAVRRHFGVKTSPNGKHVGIIWMKKKDKKSSKIITYGALSMDQELNVEWKNSMDKSDLPHEDWITTFNISNKGDILAAVRFKVEASSGYSLETFLWNAKSKELTQILNGKSCIHSDFFTTKKGLTLVSPYLNDGLTKTNGLTLTWFDDMGHLKESKDYPFPNDPNVSNGLRKEMGKELAMVKIHEDEDGLWLVGEENYSDMPVGGGLEKPQPSATGSSIPTNFSKSILVMKLDSDAEMSWARSIRKNQKHAGDALNLSHWSNLHEGQLQIVVNDQLDNMKLRPDANPKVYTGGSGGNLLYFEVMGHGTVVGHNIGEVNSLRGIGLKGFDSHAVFCAGDFISVEMKKGKKENALMYFDYDH